MGGVSSSGAAAAAAQPAGVALTEPHALPSEPSVTLPGSITGGGGACRCTLPPLSVRQMQAADKEYLSTLDAYSLQALVQKKGLGEELFAEGFGRVEAGKRRIDKALANLIGSYTDLAKKRHTLEEAEQDNALVHLRHCSPLKNKLGVYAQCQEEFRAALDAYRSQLKAPECAVGATIPLAPASFVPVSDDPLSQEPLAAAASLASGGSWVQRPGQLDSPKARRRRRPAAFNAAAAGELFL
eukprot:TRINITY_DN51412_c0_g1_i1.p1 TRINITY_DN51412_c0_g1~~TRINITY_DN51412_c0_g1_i1.p1  ORF type:complete len:241 (-),score=63.31 TRINITY_DN51412_c0_g1_i1:91-813(-)